MHILHLSDTHNQHRQLGNLPAADVIIHSGDISFAGTGEEVMDFIEWFGSLNYQYKIFIAGNHDYALEGITPERIQRFLPDSCFYLYNSGITINGIHFWGIPFFFSPDETNSVTETIEFIPDDTDVLITHRPPYGILDQSNNIRFGCTDLLQAVTRIRPAYHLFGHIHDAYGIEKQKRTTFANAAVVDAEYKLDRKPFIFNV
jgi:predicted phosphodiesterase